tara:strand:+ start:1590 stop:1994 length:405 start_codon:yes stop_codon:yes gene_type:complete
MKDSRMAMKKKTVSVRLDDDAKRRVDLAAKLLGQSVGAFLGKSGEERARQVLRTWAAEQHRRGEASFSELAQETGLGVEEIMESAGVGDREEGFRIFLASCRTIAESQGNSEFLRLGEEAVNSLRAEMLPPAAT